MMTQCDILIIGAGPAGMAAALAAAPSGASIAVIDDNPAPGGQIWRDGPNALVPVAARRMREQLAACANVRMYSGTRVISAPAPHTLLLEDAERGWTQQWKTLILCTGARELLLPFPGWTLPGVTGAGGLQALIKSGMPVAGERIVVAGSGPLLLAAAASAHKAGAKVVRVAEQADLAAVLGFAARLVGSPGKVLQALTLMHPQYRTSSHVLAVRGQGRVESVQLQQGDRRVEIDCDRVACGFGLVPNTQLGQLLGCSLTPTGLAVDGWQATSQAGIYAAGECTGVGGSERALVQGCIAGLAAAGDSAAAQKLWPERSRWDAFARQLARSFTLAPQLKKLPQADTLVCRCEDVPYAALQACAGWTDAKLHTRCGMGACQGRVCGAAMQFLLGWQQPVPRNPLAPARVGTLAASYEKGK
ncbi:FAD/NAD(P)-binding oxidoreductase [Rhodoferax sp.]|uniref:NAD(P)/FAD-dependent oxidoreductase n=1 Tax=Rhodoferax sp. TaxID=50421 RepID=UPI0025D36ED9|nr:FAD/NAD(P)-binding oxidoreductase [Rhodoferax sp.]